MEKMEDKVLNDLKKRDEKLKKMGLYNTDESNRNPLENPEKPQSKKET